eukprot:415010-Rhodomonas_salina.1
MVRAETSTENSDPGRNRAQVSTEHQAATESRPVSGNCLVCSKTAPGHRALGRQWGATCTCHACWVLVRDLAVSEPSDQYQEMRRMIAMKGHATQYVRIKRWYDQTPSRRATIWWGGMVNTAICRRAYYAMSGTDIRMVETCLRA